MHRVIICKWQNAQNKQKNPQKQKTKREQTVSHLQVPEHSWFQTELSTKFQAATRTRPPSPWLGPGSSVLTPLLGSMWGQRHQALQCYVQVQWERENAFSCSPLRVLKFILIGLVVANSNNHAGHGLGQGHHFNPREVPTRSQKWIIKEDHKIWGYCQKNEGWFYWGKRQ